MHRLAATAALGLMVLPTPAAATEEDTQFWVYLVGTAEVADGVVATVEVSPRLREGPEQVLNRAAIDVAVADGLTLGASVVYVEFAGGHEIRPQQQAIYSTGPLTLRTRLEQRFFAGAERPLVRLRQQARLAKALDAQTQLAGAVELLYILQSDVPGEPARVEQWRGEISVRRRISPQFDVTLAYRGFFAPREGREDGFSHVPVLTLTWRP